MAASLALTAPRAGRSKVRSWLRRLSAVAAAVAAAWLAGFAWFLYLGTRDAVPPPHVDAIVGTRPAGLNEWMSHYAC